MILNHCVRVLKTGHSEFVQANFTDEEKVFFKLLSGVSAKRLDSMKSALIMIEVMKEAVGSLDLPEQYEWFDHFVNYIFEQFNESVAMALVKYALSDRKLTIKKLTQSAVWPRISSVFKPVMIHNSDDPKEVKKYGRFERVHNKLKDLRPVSQAISEYVASEPEALAA